MVMVWWLVERVQDHVEQKRDAERRAEILALRQRYVGIRSDVPGAHEMLGDALRQAGHAQEAVAAYEKAKTLFPTVAAGQHLDAKIRLARLEIAETTNPEFFRQTLATRESICRRCGLLCPASEENCTQCGTPLLVSGFFETLTKGKRMRGDLIRELWPIAAKTAVILIAIGTASFLSPEVKICLLVATVIVVPFTVLKQIGDPTLE